jgi:hypothetical protein
MKLAMKARTALVATMGLMMKISKRVQAARTSEKSLTRIIILKVTRKSKKEKHKLLKKNLVNYLQLSNVMSHHPRRLNKRKRALMPPRKRRQRKIKTPMLLKEDLPHSFIFRKKNVASNYFF